MKAVHYYFQVLLDGSLHANVCVTISGDTMSERTREEVGPVKMIYIALFSHSRRFHNTKQPSMVLSHTRRCIQRSSDLMCFRLKGEQGEPYSSTACSQLIKQDGLDCITYQEFIYSTYSCVYVSWRHGFSWALEGRSSALWLQSFKINFVSPPY